MRRIGIGYGNVKYASVVGNNTTETAIAGSGSTNVINTLAEGAIAIYGLKISTGLQELITTTIAGTPANFANYSEFIIFQGGKGTGELVEIGRFKANELAGLKANAYIAPTKSVSYIGYDGSTGLLNLPTIVNGDSAAVEVKTRMGSVNPIFQDYFVADAGVLTSTADGYSILALLANQLNAEPTNVRHVKAEIVSNSASIADFTGTATALKFTKGSKTVSFVIQDATGWVDSTGTATGTNVIGVPHQNMVSVTFTANLLGTGAGRHLVTIGGTTYNVADAGTAAQNATAIAAAINAGTQATATVSTADVTIVMKSTTIVNSKVTVTYSADDITWTVPTLTVNTTVGSTIETIYKVAATATGAASFKLDRAFEGETMYAIGGTSLLVNTGVITLAGTPQYGLRITGYTAGHDIIVSRSGVLQYATLSTESTTVPIVKASYGMGTYSQVADMENQAIYWRGASDTAELPNKSPLNKYAVSGKTYDIYSILVKTQYEAPFGFSNKTGNNISNISVAFETGYTSAGDNQTAFDDIVNALAGYYSVPIENGSLA